MSKTFKKDITGQEIGVWKILTFIPNEKHKSHWRVQCLRCNAIDPRDIRIDHLIDTKCKCYTKEMYESRILDLTNRIFGKLTALQPTDKRKHGCVVWLAQCSCKEQTIIEVSSAALQSGNVRSCGCLLKEIQGQRLRLNLKKLTSGLLTAINPTDKRNKSGSIIWNCVCNCGEETLVPAEEFFDTYSCGCIKRSKGEHKIKSLLKQNGINHDTERTFDDLRSDKNSYLRFDFEVKDEHDKLLYLIEFHGKQHYLSLEEISGWYTIDDILKIRKHDKMKIQYCLHNNIPLIIIPYWEFNNLDINMLKTENNKFLIKRS